MGAGKRITISVGVGVLAALALLGFFQLADAAPWWVGPVMMLGATALLASTFAYGVMGD